MIFKFEHWYPKYFKIGAITIGHQIWFAGSIHDVSNTLIKHEMIHIEQIRKLGWIRFYTQYVKELSIGLKKHKNYDKAYRSISFEVEAYRRQDEPLTTAESNEVNVAKIAYRRRSLA